MTSGLWPVKQVMHCLVKQKAVKTAGCTLSCVFSSWNLFAFESTVNPQDFLPCSSLLILINDFLKGSMLALPKWHHMQWLSRLMMTEYTKHNSIQKYGNALYGPRHKETWTLHPHVSVLTCHYKITGINSCSNSPPFLKGLFTCRCRDMQGFDPILLQEHHWVWPLLG